MSLRTFSVIVFALVTLQGCASTVTASSKREPGIAAVNPLGRIRADALTRSEPRHVTERNIFERRPSRDREHRSTFCRRCSN